MEELQSYYAELCNKIDSWHVEIREWRKLINPHAIDCPRNAKICNTLKLLKAELKGALVEKEEVAKKLERSNRESWRESFDSLCSLVNKFCEHEERKAGKRIEAELQVSTPIDAEP